MTYNYISNKERLEKEFSECCIYVKNKKWGEFIQSKTYVSNLTKILINININFSNLLNLMSNKKQFKLEVIKEFLNLYSEKDKLTPKRFLHCVNNLYGEK